MSSPPPTGRPTGEEELDGQAAPAASAEDRKAAAALSALDAREDDGAAKASQAIDEKALGEAMSRLEMLDKASSGATTGTSGSKSTTTKAAAKDADAGNGPSKPPETEARKKIKIDATDVALLVEELELTKPRATDLLRSHEGNAVQAIRAYIKASA